MERGQSGSKSGAVSKKSCIVYRDHFIGFGTTTYILLAFPTNSLCLQREEKEMEIFFWHIFISFCFQKFQNKRQRVIHCQLASSCAPAEILNITLHQSDKMRSAIKNFFFSSLSFFAVFLQLAQVSFWKDSNAFKSKA